MGVADNDGAERGVGRSRIEERAESVAHSHSPLRPNISRTFITYKIVVRTLLCAVYSLPSLDFQYQNLVPVSGN